MSPEIDRYRHIARTVGWAGLVSLMSLAAAWGAIALLLSHNLKLAALVATAAFLLDTADGYLARRLNTAGDFGRQLDSMIDAINYSLFAALITQQILLPNLLGWLVGFAILAFGILRLVLFNLDGYLTEGDVHYYRGVVTCHLSLASVLLLGAQRLVALPDWLIAAILLVLAVGQLSNIRTRKTGVLMFWIPASILIGIGGYLWL